MAAPRVRWFGTVEDGVPVLDRPKDFKHSLATLEGQRIELEVRKKQSKRSLAQNRWLWGPAYGVITGELLKHPKYRYIIDQLLEEFGNEPTQINDILREQLHEHLLKQHFGVVNVPSPFGGMMQIAKRRSSKLNTVEFAAFMEFVARYAATEVGDGIYVGLPDDDELPPQETDDE